MNEKEFFVSRKESTVEIKTFQNLCEEEYSFFIPSYQRGFRWTKSEIRALLDDLIEFEEKHDNQEKYFLQMIMVQKRGDNKYELADGQQRLTILWILYQLKRFFNGDKNWQDPYTLTFEEKRKYDKTRDDFLEALKKTTKSLEETTNSPSKSVKLFDSIETDNLDSKYFLDAVKYIVADYTYEIGGEVQSFEDLAKDYFFKEDKEYIFLWYEVVSMSEKSAGPNRDSELIRKYQNINASSVQLTEAELIKAYFIQNIRKPNEMSENEMSEKEFTLQWEQIERDLNNDNIWFFMAPSRWVKTYETRIDYLFEINTFADERVYNQKHEVSNSIKKRIKNEGAKNVWQDIINLYETLLSWHSDYYLYHTIGYLVATDDKGDALARLYKECKNKNKSEIIDKIGKKIKEVILNVASAAMNDNQRSKDKKKDRDKKLDAATIKYIVENLEYPHNEKNTEKENNEQKTQIVNFILLFNIALLLNAYKVNPDNNAERFPFDYYSKTGADIEHINAKHLENDDFEKADSDEEKYNRKITWAENTIKIIEEEEDKKRLKENLESIKNQFLNDKKQFPDGEFDNLVNDIEDSADINKLNNLSLLDKYVNRKYKDIDFIDKRGHIIAARFGLPIPTKPNKEKNEDTDFKSVQDDLSKAPFNSIVFYDENEQALLSANKEDDISSCYFTTEDANRVKEACIETDTPEDIEKIKLYQLKLNGTGELIGKSGKGQSKLRIKKGELREHRPCYLLIKGGSKVYGGVITAGMYERSVIYPGTMWAFMRQYNPKDATSSSQSDQSMIKRWTSDDRGAYEDQLVDSVTQLLKL